MPDVLTALTELAVTIFRERGRAVFAEWRETFRDMDPVLAEAQRRSWLLQIPNTGLVRVAELALAEPELAAIASRAGELDPMVIHPGGGARMPTTGLIASLFTSALLYMYCLRLPEQEGTFVRTVLEGFDELRRAARGERVRAYVFTGIASVTLGEGKQIDTPWGTLRAAPAVTEQPRFFMRSPPRTTCVLAEERLVPVVFDRAPEPRHSFDTPDGAANRSADMLPLACALATADSSQMAVPLITWSSFVVPFQTGLGWSSPPLTWPHGPDTNVSDRIGAIEEWARTVDRVHVSSVDIAARRLVSAVGHRSDKSDSLIDAVMAWENLLGTSAEITFRISAALAKMLERDTTKRKALRKELAEIYGIRSRLIHGATVDASAISNACAKAIEVAAKALRISYTKGIDWLALNSYERCDAILLEWP